MKQQAQRLGLIVFGCTLVGVLATACDSTPQIATATARAAGTNTVNITLTVLAGGQPNVPTAFPAAPSTAPAIPATSGPALMPATARAIGTAPATEPGTQAATGAATQASTARADSATSAATISVGTQAATVQPTSPATTVPTQNATQAATAEPTKVAQGASTDAPTVAAPPTLNPVMATVASARTMTAAAPTRTPIPIVASPVDWYKRMTLYSLYVRAFRDSNGDGIGDLQGVIDGLDYLQSLGVNTIWLLPIFKSPSVHGYDITDYYSINPDYGTNEDLSRLLKEAHKRGLKILSDYVVNHTSSQHPFFKDAFNNPASAYSEYYLWGNKEQTTYSTFAGVQEMPKLNFDSEKAIKFATDIALYWLDPNTDGDFSDGFDGLRCDVATGPFRTFWAHLRSEMTKLNPKALLLGELFVQTPQDMQGYVGDGKLDTAFDFPLYVQMSKNWDANGDGVFSGKSDAALAFGLARNPANYYPPGVELVRFIANHDTNRIMSDVEGNTLRAKAAAVFLMTGPGPVALYYGDEIGMTGSKCEAPDYDACRREPLDWYKALSGAGQTAWFRRNNAPDDGVSIEEQNAQPDSLLALYRALGRLRAEPVLQSASWDMPEGSDLYILRKWDGKTMILTVINFSTQDQIWKPSRAALTVGNDVYELPRLDAMLSGGVRFDEGVYLLAAGGYAVFRLAR